MSTDTGLQTGEEWLNNAMLLDFYGSTLTNRQRELCDGYYAQNLSLAELGENFGISRQAAHGAIKSSLAVLSSLERKLGLVRKHAQRLEIIRSIKRIAGEHPALADDLAVIAERLHDLEFS
jgi:predicted DNA-binding protein YlxM (UPF0122 family)